MLTMEAAMAFFCITFQWLFLSVSAVTYHKLFSRFMVKGCSIMWSIKPLLGDWVYTNTIELTCIIQKRFLF